MWRRCAYKDAVESSLSLLDFLCNVDGDSISTFFTEKFFYNSRSSFTKAAVENCNGKWQSAVISINFFHDCELFIRGIWWSVSVVIMQGVRKCNLPLRSPSTVIWTGTTGLYSALCRRLCKRLGDQSSPSKLKIRIGQIFCYWVNIIFRFWVSDEMKCRKILVRLVCSSKERGGHALVGGGVGGGNGCSYNDVRGVGVVVVVQLCLVWIVSAPEGNRACFRGFEERNWSGGGGTISALELLPWFVRPLFVVCMFSLHVARHPTS